MATWARGLSEALRGYQEGRAQRQQWDYQMERDRRAEEQARLAAERQTRLDAQNKALMEAQIAQMQAAQARAADELAMRQVGARQELQASGYRPDGSPVEGFLKFMGQDPAQLPTETIGGVTLRRVARSDAQMAEDRKRLDAVGEAARRDRERAAVLETLPPNVRARAKGLPYEAVQRLATDYAGQAMPKPAAPRQPLTQNDSEGNPYFSEDGGRTWRLASVMGGDAPVARPVARPTPSGGAPQAAMPQAAAPQAIQPQAAQPQAARPRFGSKPSGGDATANRKFMDSELASQQLVSMLKEYKEALQKTGTSLIPSSDPGRVRLQTLARNIQLLYKSEPFANLGVLTGPDLTLLEEVISSPVGIKANYMGAAGIGAQVDEVLNTVERNRQIRYRMAGREDEYRPILPSRGNAAADLANQFTRRR